MKELYKKQRRAYIYSFLFGLFLMLILLSSAALAMFHTGPIILGTEMNANGQVEYMCLGNGCTGLVPMDW